MNGVINIYKEKGCTSFHIVYEVRRMTGESKVGHTGTLDPGACGVLPVCIGKATKLVGQLTDTDKTYRCVMLFGKRTDTQDLSGTVMEEMQAEDVYSALLSYGRTEHDNKNGSSGDLSAEERKQIIYKNVAAVMDTFIGEVQQLPPMYSAVKVEGVKLLDLARHGVEIERKKRKVTIYSISDLKLYDDLLHLSFTVECSKGTYIRTLCQDIGERMGIPACMEELERTVAAGMKAEDSVTLEKAWSWALSGELKEHITPPDDFLMDHDALIVKDSAVKHLIYGNYLYSEDIFSLTDDPKKDRSEDSQADGPEEHNAADNDGKQFRVYDRSGEFYALYAFDAHENCYKCVKMFRDL